MLNWKREIGLTRVPRLIEGKRKKRQIVQSEGTLNIQKGQARWKRGRYLQIDAFAQG